LCFVHLCSHTALLRFVLLGSHTVILCFVLWNIGYMNFNLLRTILGLKTCCKYFGICGYWTPVGFFEVSFEFQYFRLTTRLRWSY
jgi:hypothetical protein